MYDVVGNSRSISNFSPHYCHWTNEVIRKPQNNDTYLINNSSVQRFRKLYSETLKFAHSVLVYELTSKKLPKRPDSFPAPRRSTPNHSGPRFVRETQSDLNKKLLIGCLIMRNIPSRTLSSKSYDKSEIHFA